MADAKVPTQEAPNDGDDDGEPRQWNVCGGIKLDFIQQLGKVVEVFLGLIGDLFLDLLDGGDDRVVIHLRLQGKV